jgi:2'-5' RNA ligase
MVDKWRLFIAVELPPAVLSLLSQVQEQLKKRTPPGTVRWVNPDGIHLTLKFLGDVPVGQRGELERALTTAVQGHAPFTLSVSDLGCFPNPRQPRVVWVGIHETSGALLALRNAVEEHIAPQGYPTEDRAFSPHLTVGRVRREARRADVQKLGELVAGTPSSEESQRWQVTSVSLIRSELKPGGAVYTPLVHAPLG